MAPLLLQLLRGNQQAFSLTPRILHPVRQQIVMGVLRLHIQQLQHCYCFDPSSRFHSLSLGPVLSLLRPLLPPPPCSLFSVLPLKILHYLPSVLRIKIVLVVCQALYELPWPPLSPLSFPSPSHSHSPAYLFFFFLQTQFTTAFQTLQFLFLLSRMLFTQLACSHLIWILIIWIWSIHIA